MDEEYLQCQEEKTVRDHKRDIIQNCIISYRYFFLGLVLLAMHSIFHAGRYPIIDGNYRDYKLTFDDEILA